MEQAIASYAQLRRSGASRSDITRAIAAGRIHRIAIGWYARDWADAATIRAIAAGGRLGCLSGCAQHGLWVPHLNSAHMVHGAGITPGPLPGLQVHTSRKPQPRSPIWPLADCLEQVLHRHSLEPALIAFESAIHLKLLQQEELGDILRLHRTRGESVALHLDSAESGTETRVRLFLRSRRVKVRPQVSIAGVGRVDLLVGRSLVIECDSRAHHSSQATYEADRRRDLAARRLGFDTLRLSYVQVWHEWATTREALIHQLRRRAHSRPPKA